MQTEIRTKQDILSVIRQNESHLRTLGVKRIGLFGSFVRGDQRTNSDIDFLVEFEPGRKSFDNFINLSFLMKDLLRRHVEIVTLESLSPYIGPHILAEVEYAAISA